MHDLFGTEDLRQFLRLLAGWDDLFESPILLEGDLVEEADRGDAISIDSGASFLSLVR